MHRIFKTKPILEFWGPYAERGGGCWDERMDSMHLSVFHSISNHAQGKRSFLLRLHVHSTQARDCTTFTLHDLTDFYVERATAHRIKIIIIHVFITAGQIQKRN